MQNRAILSQFGGILSWDGPAEFNCTCANWLRGAIQFGTKRAQRQVRSKFGGKFGGVYSVNKRSVEKKYILVKKREKRIKK